MPTMTFEQQLHNDINKLRSDSVSPVEIRITRWGESIDPWVSWDVDLIVSPESMDADAEELYAGLGELLNHDPYRILEEGIGEHHDIFSLGAVCYQLFTGQAPAESPLALSEKLRVHRGLRVSAVLNGAPESLDQLVQYSTDPDVSNRLDTAAEFLEFLDKVEEELTTPSNQLVGDPTHAKPGDILPGGYEVVRKLGTGSTATAMLVRKENQEFVAKISVDTEHNDRVKDEGEVLQKLDSPLIVRCHSMLQFGDRTAILLDQAGDKNSASRTRTYTEPDGKPTKPHVLPTLGDNAGIIASPSPAELYPDPTPHARARAKKEFADRVDAILRLPLTDDEKSGLLRRLLNEDTSAV